MPLLSAFGTDCTVLELSSNLLSINQRYVTAITDSYFTRKRVLLDGRMSVTFRQAVTPRKNRIIQQPLLLRNARDAITNGVGRIQAQLPI